MSPRILHPERPLCAYDAQGLEFLLLRLKGAEIGWRRGDKPQSRRLDTTSVSLRMHLVEGGRWLLVVSHTGSVTYFDLDSPTITEVILIPDQIVPPSRMLFGDISTEMVVDMDRASPHLAFNMAFSFCSTKDTRGPTDHKIQVWHVGLVLDERQLGVGLTSRLVATFPLETNICFVYALSLRGPHIAFSIRCLGYGPVREKTFVVDWERANGSSNYSRFLIHPLEGPVRSPPFSSHTYVLTCRKDFMHLLPGAKLFAISCGGLYLFDYSNIEETTSSLSTYDPRDMVSPVWKENTLHFSARGVSPHFYADTVRFVIRGISAIYG
ncbi:hypothetical protein M413DRAFT_137650 [Hebeloma cylindrosporum]|uniref:Uncharacterized protein n=1 Tax=Hebeloma cylindrosporum TaxID=76867 RepID=A0A0C3CBZ5_HEBCY|nr:hypothetical protein M413DRAFT_137650 [Hebeloma cylindrosporum h7]